ncbi:PREDICTED: chromodomain-helicase-DNA-binding protein 3-like isoform X2 [Lupinus angustifolius]|uniref:chromodomain-helicase-DNA-binding protein 3-like isoform X2 n=1 Tax=Lupinus angustifolius TaxID=3871 RepID=UPI00092FD323|nr:PREDICTED: chromodomain-helicase-DNA-binding protein 3-like isoform X2 [Lupinus angustifolius]
MKVETLVTEDGGGHSNFWCTEELTEEYKDNTQADCHMKDDGQVVCYNCLHGGTLLRCCGKGCRRRYHSSCLDPPLKYTAAMFWYCIWCVKKMVELGVHSVSEGVESVLDSREVVSEDKVVQREYFVKYQGLAHAHNCWIPETRMLLEAPKLLAKFKKKPQVIRCTREWSIPYRLLLKRKFILPKRNDEHLNGEDDCRYQWLVKWTGLGYDNVSWELDNASFMTSSEGMKLTQEYECRRMIANRLSKPFETNKGREASFAELPVLPCGDSPGFYNQYLSYVNKLHMCWNKRQSALIVDDHVDQERAMKVILFILSLHCNVERPFLIISGSTSLSMWETEFLHLAPSVNLVVYKGDKNAKSSIRELEFYNDDGSILFQILLVSYDVIIEDLVALSCIQWEVIIIDECQRPKICKHLDNISILAAEMKLVLVSGLIKDDRADFIKLLSFLKSGHHGLDVPPVETFFSASISDLKRQLEKYVAFRSTRFVEYWVPAPLSSLQLEQYCSMLLSHSTLLCSGQKSDNVAALHDLIISTRKCCGHPYLLDQSLHSFVTRGLPVEEHLNIGIKASGKLQLLEKILLEARSRGLRVIILFQSTANGSASIGDILDDVLCQRFGKDCYVRYDRLYRPSMKQAALDTFNDRESGKFVFLIENRACLPSVKLSSVDTVILFDSDWDLHNDLRALHKMSISFQRTEITVFRLYSPFTVEERALILAKEGIALESDMQLITQSTFLNLLKWGASYLFNKLDDLHCSGSSVSAADISTDESLLNDVTGELLSRLVYSSGDTDCHEWSFIFRAQLNGGEFARNILLAGERVMKKSDNGPNIFSWSDLLNGRQPRWIFLSVSSQRTRKTVKYFDHIEKESEYLSDPIMSEKKKVSKANVNPNRRKLSKDNVPERREVIKGSVDPNRRKASKDSVDPKKRKFSSKYNIDLKRRKVSKDIVDSKYLKTRLEKKKKPSAVRKARKMNGTAEQNKLHDIPESAELLPKPDISVLCDVLHLPKNVKAIAMRILEHIFKHYNISCEDGSTTQAFKISVCWLAASFLKHKIDRKYSLVLAKLYLNFICKEEEIIEVYSELRKFKQEISSCLQNGLHVENCNINSASDSEIPQLKDLSGEKQKGFQGPCLSNILESATNKHLQTKSPTTVLSSHDMAYTEKFHSSPSMAHENFLSQNTSCSLPLETDAMELESGEEDDRMNAMSSVAAEVSYPENQNKIPNSSNNPHNVSHVTCSFERQISIKSTEIAGFDGKDSEDLHILVNEVVAGDNSINMATHTAQLDSVETDALTCDITEQQNKVPNSSNNPHNVIPVTSSLGRQSSIRSTEIAVSDFNVSEGPHIFVNELVAGDNSMNIHPAQLDSVETDALTCDSTVVPDFRQSDNVLSPVCGQSTTSEFAETTLPFMQPSYANSSSSPLPQMTMPSIPSFLEDNSTSTVMRLEAEVLLQALNDSAETVNPSFIPPVTQQPFPIEPLNENTRHVPHSISNAQYATSETPDTTYRDPMVIEMERIKKVKEEVSKIHEKKTSQLQSDYQKEVEMLREKYTMLIQEADTAVALKIEELEMQCKIACMNKALAEAWVDAEYIDQGMDCA